VVQQSNFLVGSGVLVLEQVDHEVEDYDYEEQATRAVSHPQFF
jgi:hypothetical protein